MPEGNMDWLTKPPFLTKERGFLLKMIGSRRFYADPDKHGLGTSGSLTKGGVYA
jgi:hypothetical protein